MDLQYCEQPLPAGDPGRRRAEAPLAGADLRRRGLPHARRRRGLRRARARDRDQAREVGRDPRGGADDARRPRARPRRDARLHGRVRASGSRQEPRSRASATTSISTGTCCSPPIRGPVLNSRTVSSDPRTGPASASRARRLLILAEGHSADPHYGKTARGVLRYRPEQVVAILDSARAGETQDGVPDRRQRRRGAPPSSRRPRSSASRRRAAASRPPGASC